jgi:SAM-dependent methyltransferase
VADLTPPPLRGLPEAVAACAAYLGRATAARGGRYVNHEGGDVAATGNARSLVHHVANYLAAAELAEQLEADGAVVDVGSGVGALGSWLADRLGQPLHIVDADPGVRNVARRAFPGVGVHADLASVASGSAALVTAMEVVEHVPRGEQLGFVRDLVAVLRPGGLLVCSTPDETRYLGRWSGYEPHIGTVDAAGLEHLLTAATGRSATVWRLEGPAFAVGPVRRVLEPLGNRAWAGLQRALPGAAARVAGTAGAALAAAPAGGVPALAGREDLLRVTAVAAIDHSQSNGSGLLGAVRC